MHGAWLDSVNWNWMESIWTANFDNNNKNLISFDICSYYTSHSWLLDVQVYFSSYFIYFVSYYLFKVQSIFFWTDMITSASQCSTRLPHPPASAVSGRGDIAKNLHRVEILDWPSESN